VTHRTRPLRPLRHWPNTVAGRSSRPRTLQGPCADRAATGCRQIIRLKSEGVTPSEFASRLGIGRASVYRVLDAQQNGDRVAA
jgi:hypothetical protein